MQTGTSTPNNLNQMLQKSEIISQISSQSSHQSCRLSIHTEGIQQIPKKTLHPVVFMLNILWMLLCCHCSLYYIFGPSAERPMKGKVAAVSLGVTLVVSIPTFLYLTSIKELIKLFFLIDTILVMTLAAVVAFINMIMLFDKNGEWYWKVIESAFAIELVFYSAMMRVMLVHLKWPKWQLVTLKLHVMINCIMFMICGVYFIWVDFTYTKHMLPTFDGKVHEFMVLFIFTMFTYSYEMYAKVTDLDHTGDLRYIYTIKNMDANLPKKRESIKQHKRQSINSLKQLGKNKQFMQFAKPYRVSRFAKIQILGQ